jgi:uncharacterized membrane protein YeaQ/YmgE (transglycosylase-associated protein family)
MEVPIWLTRLLVIGSIATAIATNLTNIKPVYGIAAMVVAGVIGAFGDGFKQFILPGGVTVAGLLLTAGAVVLYITSNDTGLFSFIPEHALALLAQIGPILTILGGKLKSAPVEPTV